MSAHNGPPWQLGGLPVRGAHPGVTEPLSCQRWRPRTPLGRENQCLLSPGVITGGRAAVGPLFATLSADALAPKSCD